MKFSENFVGGLVMMAIAGYAFYRMILLWEAAKPGPAFAFGALWIAAVAGAMWFAWPQPMAPGAAAAQQRLALTPPLSYVRVDNENSRTTGFCRVRTGVGLCGF